MRTNEIHETAKAYLSAQLPKWVVKRLHEINDIKDYEQRYEELSELIGLDPRLMGIVDPSLMGMF